MDNLPADKPFHLFNGRGSLRRQMYAISENREAENDRIDKVISFTFPSTLSSNFYVLRVVWIKGSRWAKNGNL